MYLTLSGLASHTAFRLIQSSNPDSTNWAGFANVGYETNGKTWSWGPLASLQWDDAISSAFTAAGSRLLIHSNLTNNLQFRVGLLGTYQKKLTQGSLKAQAQIMWERLYAGNGLVDVEFNRVPSTRIGIGESASTRDSAWSSLSLGFHSHRGWSLQGAYTLDLGNQLTVQQIDLSFHVSF